MQARLENLKHAIESCTCDNTESTFAVDIGTLMFSSCVESVWVFEEAEGFRSILEQLINLVQATAISSLHRDYLKLCLKYSLLNNLNCVFDREWTDLDPYISLEIVSEFYFLSASIHIVRRDFVKSKFALHSVLLIPHQEAHIPALRKLFLIEIILNGSISPLPSHIERRCSVVSSIWEGLTTMPEARSDVSPEKKLKNTPSIVHPEEYRELAYSTRGLTELKPRLIEGGDWELALCLDIYDTVRYLKKLSCTVQTMSVEFCMQFSNRSQLFSAISVFNAEKGVYTIVELEGDWLKFAN